MKQALKQYYELRDTLIECYSNDVIFNFSSILARVDSIKDVRASHRSTFKVEISFHTENRDENDKKPAELIKAVIIAYTKYDEIVNQESNIIDLIRFTCELINRGDMKAVHIIEIL